ncbi:MAG: hypothetical protein ACLUI3_17790 [Christensenellales bacterium]
MEKHRFWRLCDFDHTLSPRDMQEYGFIPDLGMEADVFWKKCLKSHEAQSDGSDSGLYVYDARGGQAS